MNLQKETTEKRIELKEVFRAKDRMLVESAIKFSRFSFGTTYPQRQVNSIYYDTFDFESLEESIEGGSQRKKVRLRWYGNIKDDTKATLEIKMKRGHLSWKKIYRNSHNIKPQSKQWRNFIETASNESSFNCILCNLVPQSIVSYQRSYFASFDGKIRITIDHDLKTYIQNNTFVRNFDYGKSHKDVLVLEIKIAEKNQPLLRKILEEFPFSPKRFSKYCESMLL